MVAGINHRRLALMAGALMAAAAAPVHTAEPEGRPVPPPPLPDPFRETRQERRTHSGWAKKRERQTKLHRPKPDERDDKYLHASARRRRQAEREAATPASAPSTAERA